MKISPCLTLPPNPFEYKVRSVLVKWRKNPDVEAESLAVWKMRALDDKVGTCFLAQPCVCTEGCKPPVAFSLPLR